jgi:hypothetical protein
MATSFSGGRKTPKIKINQQENVRKNCQPPLNIEWVLNVCEKGCLTPPPIIIYSMRG